MARLSRRWALLVSTSALAFGAVIVAACVGDDPAASGSGGTSGNPSGDGGTPSADGSSETDGEACAVTCSDPSTLKRCDGTTETCLFGCDTAGGAHCKAVYPSGLVLPADLSTPGVKAIKIEQNKKLVTDTGEIENLRAANVDPLQMEVKDGIGFRLADDKQGHKVAIWTFDSLEIVDNVTIRFTSTNPAALVAAKSVTIAGVIDARGYNGSGTLCGDTSPGPGGFSGGATTAAGGGPGGGVLAKAGSGGGPGGGGNGGIGGKGGPGYDAGLSSGGDGGAAYQTPTLIPLVGGSGGAGSASSTGGGGGGALQIVAVEAITIGAGSSPGGINAGGCNGGAGFFGSTGGGGGSGGSILLETRTLTIASNGHIAATGGGGGSGNGGAATPGQLDFGGTGGAQSSDYGFGGLGASGTPVVNGGGGASAKTSSGAGGAGGGAVGRIRINNRTGSFTPPPNSMAPQLNIADNPPATVGTLDVR